VRSFTRLVFGLVVVATSSLAAAMVVRRQVPAFGTEADPEFSVVAAMRGAVFSPESQRLVEGRAVAFMGGIELHLDSADLSPGAYLTLRAVMGGIDVIVPSHWRVEVMGRAVMGGIGNLTDPDSATGDVPVLLVDAFAVMGGIRIRTEEDV
jgi:hypothetical protein